MDNPAEIAAGLTKAQRERVAAYDWTALPPEYWYLQSTGHSFISHWILPTDEAVAIRAHLENPDAQ